MNKIKKTITFDNDVSENLLARSQIKDPEARIWPSLTNAALKRYYWLLEQSLPLLALNEWQVIADAYSGVYVDEPITTLSIARDIMDHYGVIDVNDLNPIVEKTVRKVHELNQVEQYAILDVITRFWADHELQLDFDAAIHTLTQGKFDKD